MIYNLKTVFIIIMLVLFHCSDLAYAQDYKIGVGDVLEFVFWQRPDLNSRCTVDPNGAVTLPIIGTIQVANSTPQQVEELILAQIRFYDTQITNISTNVLEYNSKSFSITGQVRNPGKYGFMAIPSLWDIIARAGGPNADADLRQITIVRKLETPTVKDTVIWINLIDAMEANELNDLPVLKPGDTIFIQGRARNLSEQGILSSFGSGLSSGLGSGSSRDNIYVMGEVNRQGIVPFSLNINLLEALIYAGGPTRNAKLNTIRIIREQHGSTKIEKVNLKKSINKNNMNPYFLKKGDTIIVPYRSPFRETFVFEIVRAVLFGSITTFLYFYIRDQYDL